MSETPARIEAVHPQVSLLVSGLFDSGPGYSSWRHAGTRDWLLIYTLGGRGRFGFPTGEMVANPGDLVLYRPDTPHDYATEPRLRRWRLLWFHFHARPHWLEWLNWPEISPGLMRLRLKSDQRRIARRLSDAHHRAAGGGRQSLNLAVNALEEALLWCDAINPAASAGQLDTRVQAVVQHICRNVSQPLTLDILADVASMSVSRLSHLFRQQTGTTPQRFLEDQRIARARQLLELTSLSVKEISAEVGYENPLYFSLRFKGRQGQSPRYYRQSLARPSAPAKR